MDNRELMVTIRCLAYNHESYIRQCLEGFVMQKTNFRFEAIVHDDASTDGTAAIIREYAEKYPDIIKPIFETENQYSKRDGSIRRIMNEHTHGKYVAMCEGDDYWIDPLKLQKQVDFLENNQEYGMCYTNCNVFFQKKQKMIYNHLTRNGVVPIYTLKDFIVLRAYTAPLTWVIRKDLLQIPDISVKSMDGTFLYFAYFLANTKVKFLNITTAVYRVLENSACHFTDYSKTLAREKNILSVQLALCDYYQLGEALKLICKERFFKATLANNVAHNCKDEILEAKKSIRNKTLKEWILINIVSKSKIFRKLLLKIKNEKNNV